jgi:hypothetical protein
MDGEEIQHSSLIVGAVIISEAETDPLALVTRVV